MHLNGNESKVHSPPCPTQENINGVTIEVLCSCFERCVMIIDLHFPHPNTIQIQDFFLINQCGFRSEHYYPKNRKYLGDRCSAASSAYLPLDMISLLKPIYSYSFPKVSFATEMVTNVSIIVTSQEPVPLNSFFVYSKKNTCKILDNTKQHLMARDKLFAHILSRTP